MEETSAEIRKRVNAARMIQMQRFKKVGIYNNAAMSSKHIKKYCQIDEDSKNLLSMAINNINDEPRFSLLKQRLKMI